MNKDKLNTEFQHLAVDYLYHLGLDSTMDLKKDFGDLQYVILTRSNSAADFLANFFITQYYGIDNIKIKCVTIARNERYHIYKVANMLIVSHGIGFPSMLICLNELAKLLWHANVFDATFIRLSPGGALGLARNSIVLATEALDYQLKPEWQNIEFGDYYNYPTFLDSRLVSDILKANTNTNIVTGKVMSSSCFYNGQARLNGATEVSYSKEQRNEYLQQLYSQGVRAIDMESNCFAAFCHELEIPAALIVATLADRMTDNDLEPSLTLNKDFIPTGIKTASQVIINYILKNGAKEVSNNEN